MLIAEEHNKNTSFSDNGQTIIAAIKQDVQQRGQRLEQTAFVCLPHEQLIANLLAQIGKIDFRQKAGFGAVDEDAKLGKRHYLVIAVEEILRTAKDNGWMLCRREAFYYLFNGAYWRVFDKEELKGLLKQAAEKMGIDKFQARHFEFAEQLFKQFNEEAYLPVPVTDRNTVKINLSNGTFHITPDRQELCPPDAADFLTYQLPFGYDPTAAAPRFQQFLDRVLPDTDCQNVLAEYLGYVFISTSILKLEKCLLLYGTGANGKSVFFEVATALLGEDNVSNYSLQALTTEPAYCRAHLANKLVNYASEIHGRLEADTFKQMVSGEPVEARLPYGQPFLMKDYAKLIFNGNTLPANAEQTNAYFRRFLIVPFTQTIPESEQDKELAQKIIQTELSGVFNWVLAGLNRLIRQKNFTHSQAIANQIEDYKLQSDSVRLFLDENGYEVRADNYTALKDLYSDYRKYCTEGGFTPVNQRNFRARLEANGISVERKNFGQAAYVRKADLPY